LKILLIIFKIHHLQAPTAASYEAVPSTSNIRPLNFIMSSETEEPLPVKLEVIPPRKKSGKFSKFGFFSKKF
jgi:hypothetical protein